MTKPHSPWPRTITVAITGASGVQYGLRLVECLIAAGHRVYLLVSQAGQIVMQMEAGLDAPARPREAEVFFTKHFHALPGQIRVFGRQEWTAPVASGSNPPEAMVVCPCTTGTLAKIAGGLSTDLIDRAADVALKEGRKLILVIRENTLLRPPLGEHAAAGPRRGRHHARQSGLLLQPDPD